MGCWDVFCPLCGISLNDLIDRIKDYLDEDPELLKKIKKIPKIPSSNWTSKCTVLLQGEKAKHGFTEIGCNIKFENYKTKENFDVNDSLDDYTKFGIVLHTDCWRLAKTVLKRGLTLDDFNIKKMTNIGKHKYYLWENYKLSYLNYKEVKKYHEQDFRIDELLKTPNKLYLLYPPLLGNKLSIQNKERITKNILRLDKHKPKIRPSPLQSATLFSKNTKIKGHDGKMYHVKTVKTKKNKIKRWVLVKN
jgi:hypothetical protein